VIRAVAVVSLLILLVLVLYVPAAHPPERFLAQLRAEHEAAAAYWGGEPATRMLNRSLRMQETTAEITPIPAAKDAPSPAGVNGAVSREMSSVNQRLFNNAYFRAVDALLLLASYRFATLLEWLPELTVFVLACFVGYMVVWNVTPALHTPLMSVTNAISSIIAIGALVQIAPPLMGGDISRPDEWIRWLAVGGIVLTAINMFGGFAVTQRMLAMFRK
jgi:NAD/NADP transhydrogenase alpha subunit